MQNNQPRIRKTKCSCISKIGKYANRNSRDATAREFPNKIELLSAAVIGVRDKLSFDIDSIGEITEYSRCSEINIFLNGKLVNSLIDTSIEVTAISEKFYNDNIPRLCGKFIKAATGNKSTRLKLQ